MGTHRSDRTAGYSSVLVAIYRYKNLSVRARLQDHRADEFVTPTRQKRCAARVMKAKVVSICLQRSDEVITGYLCSGQTPIYWTWDTRTSPQTNVTVAIGHQAVAVALRQLGAQRQGGAKHASFALC